MVAFSKRTLCLIIKHLEHIWISPFAAAIRCWIYLTSSSVLIWMAVGWMAKGILETNKSDKWFLGDSMKVSVLFHCNNKSHSVMMPRAHSLPTVCTSQWHFIPVKHHTLFWLYFIVLYIEIFFFTTAYTCDTFRCTEKTTLLSCKFF